MNPNNVYVFCTTDHGNLGDHKISECEINYLKKYFPTSNIIEVPLGRYRDMKDSLINEICDDDLLFMHGGGSIGTLWPNSEIMRREIMKLWPRNIKIVFPQSIFFDTKQSDALILSKKAYNNPTVVMTCRDDESLDFSRKEFGCQSILHLI